MNFSKIVEQAITEVLEKVPWALENFEKYLSNNKWPLNYPKSKVIKTCDLIIKGEVHNDPGDCLLDLLLFRERSAPKTTKKQKDLLRKIISITESAEKVQCDHTNLGIAAFLHGGGFGPVYALPEVICLDCGLNVTIYDPKDYRKFSKEFGLQGGKKAFKTLTTWATECMKDRGLVFVDEVPNDPINEYKKAKYKWDKDIPFKISNKTALEKHSGV